MTGPPRMDRDGLPDRGARDAALPRTDRDGHPDREARDAALLARIRGGSEDAFEAVLRTEWPSLLAYAAATLGDDDAAEDLAQEAFVRLWQRRRRWRGDGSARAILFRIVRNLALNERRRSTVRRRWNLHRRAGPPPSGTATPAHILEAREDEDAAARAIQALP
jgi:RNA polymerase sigma-70 factor (ECF subfamily)